MFLKQVLVKSGKPHFNIFEQQDIMEILVYMLDECCVDFILAFDLVQIKTRGTIDCLPCHQNFGNKDYFTLFQLLVANTAQSLDLFLTPEHFLGDNSFFL